MGDITVTNWFGDLVSRAQAVATAASTDDVVNVLKNSAQYPSPVRAVGSNHSTAPCTVANGGTIIKMAKMNRILDITNETVTAQAGALYIDVAKELEKQNLQFYVNTEIGSLSVGSAACSGTKDSSMPGEYGQVGSYVSRIKMVLPSGDLLEVTDDEPELMQKVRSSYGTFGIVYEATFRVRPIQPMAVHHETFTLDDFIQQLPALKARGESLMFYIFPFDNLITVEFRQYNPDATGDPNRAIWPLRNYLWASAGPLVLRAGGEATFPIRRALQVIDGFNALWRFKLENLIQSDNTVATDQIIRYPPVADASRYTFSLWAFPEETYPTVLPACFAVLPAVLQQTRDIAPTCCIVGYCDREGPELAAFLFVRRRRDDHRSGLDGESGLGPVPGGLQPVLQRARRHSAVQSDLRDHARAGAEGAGRPLEDFRGTRARTTTRMTGC